jgi:dTDP-glucose 4,6-dehydratase
LKDDQVPPNPLRMKNSTLLITGAAGFIGSAFVRSRAAQGYKCIVLDALTYAGHRENLDPKDIPGPGGVELVEGNICDLALVRELLKKHQVSGLIHFAAESHVDRSIEGPKAFIDTNIYGTFTLLTAALEYWQGLPEGSEMKKNFRYLQVSTDEVYGTLGETGKFSETTAYAPNSPYSASKAAGDLLVRAWHHTYGLPTVTTNCSNNYGPRQYPEKLIPHMIQCAINGKPLPVYGDGGNVRDWIHVEDHSEGVWLAFTGGRLGETYCFGGNAERNNLDVVKSICAILDETHPRSDGKSYTSQISFVKDRLGHDRRYAIDDSKAVSELGFTRKYKGFEEGLKATVQWFLGNDAWVKAVMGKGK